MKQDKLKFGIIAISVIAVIIFVATFSLKPPVGNGMPIDKVDEHMMNDLSDKKLHIYSEWSNDEYLIKSFISNEEDWGYYFFEKEKNTWVHLNTYNSKNSANKNHIVTSEKFGDTSFLIVLINNDDGFMPIYSVTQSRNDNGKSAIVKTEAIDLETQYSMIVFANETNNQNYHIYFDTGNGDTRIPQ